MDNRYLDCLAAAFSYGHEQVYREEIIEKRIAYSPFFQTLEREEDSPILYMSIESLLASLFYDSRKKEYSYKNYSQCSWVAELYWRIQKESKLTFEAVFLYLPLKKAYQMYPIYHEMDFSQAIAFFQELRQKKTVLSLAMKRQEMANALLAFASGVSYSTIGALRIGRRDIRQVATIHVLKMARALHVRLETLLEVC